MDPGKLSSQPESSKNIEGGFRSIFEQLSKSTPVPGNGHIDVPYVSRGPNTSHVRTLVSTSNGRGKSLTFPQSALLFPHSILDSSILADLPTLHIYSPPISQQLRNPKKKFKARQARANTPRQQSNDPHSSPNRVADTENTVEMEQFFLQTRGNNCGGSCRNSPKKNRGRRGGSAESRYSGGVGRGNQNPGAHLSRKDTKSKNNTGAIGRNLPNNSARENKRQMYALGFKKLQEWGASPPEEIVIKLIQNAESFSLLLDEELSHDYIVLILATIAKISDSAFHSTKLKVLHLGIKGSYVQQLIRFVVSLPIHDERDKKHAQFFWKDKDNFFVNLHKYIDMVIQMMPSVAVNLIPKLLKAAVCSFPHLEVSENVMPLYELLQAKLLECVEEVERKKAKKQEECIEEEEPPDDFREISLFPLSHEITTWNQPFLRENVIAGAYRSVEHYLDVQFRLVRNDFVKPLRDGICRYIHNEKKKVQNIKLYHNVRFIKPEMCDNATGGYLIQLPIAKNKKLHLKLENSRMFMYGTLVCFTKDNFANLAFGRIVERKIELLKEGKLIVALHSEGYTVDYKANYLMVECKVYFEPYYYVLKALQHIQEDEFPMREFIVDLKRDDSLPEYFLTAAEESEHVKRCYRIPVNANGVIDHYNWPSADTLKLNTAQYAAYKNAVSRKLAIIQGPPGTGKTYLGLKVATALLQNRNYWHGRHGLCPMLVICFTNHALDQFLEGLLQVTNSIVRIGGQSRNKNLEQYNIRKIRGGAYKQAIFDHRRTVERLAIELKNMYNSIDATTSFDGMINICSVLRRLPELAGTWFQDVLSEGLRNWLFGGVNRMDERRPDINERAAVEMKKLQFDDGDADFSAAFEELDVGDEHRLDEDFLNFGDILADPYIVSIWSLEDRLRGIQTSANNLRTKEDYFVTREWAELSARYRDVAFEIDYLKKRMEEGARAKAHHPPDFIDLRNPHNMHPDDRWKMYFYWLRQYRSHLFRNMGNREAAYREVVQQYEEMKEIADVEMMRSKLVVGMTTTSAARLQASLRALRSRIVVVEEAAEIMEAHIVTSLTRHCQHLILIGDHQQLRPSTADYEMETKYHLGISLFERMVRNNVHCNVLEIQHRMRPEISRLISPTIYPNLENHVSVNGFPVVQGVDRNLYFIDHRNSESVEQDESKYNAHEVDYLIRLAQYLLHNGYQPEDISILCCYSAQMFRMFRARRNFQMLENVRICVLDNFQGEESKIILLSLVRNNSDNKIGFLKIDNRICVALSRAREGFYMMGNMDMLSKNCNIWAKIKQTLIEQDSLGEALPVRCKIHEDTVTLLKTPEDFLKVAEGGCDRPCGQLLTCGHNCKMQCHVSDRDHATYKCRESCTKILCYLEHSCTKMCHEDCGECMVNVWRALDCGHSDFYPCSLVDIKCTHHVPCELPCGHNVANKPCHVAPNDFRCPHPCDSRIDKCGHACKLNCHIRSDPDHLKYQCRKTCDRARPKCSMKDTEEEHRCRKMCYEDCDVCDIVVKKIRSCSHVYNLKCCDNVELLSCERPCKKTLQCGHKCKQTCSDPCGNCQHKVEKLVEECGHKVTMKCCEAPLKRNCPGDCPYELTCGHKCQKKCKDPCTINCKELVDSVVPLLCGHVAKIPCHLNTVVKIKDSVAHQLLDYCKAKCDAVLKCAHQCVGSCGECYQGRIHRPCMAKCGVTLVCGHVCKTPCRETCPPCKEKCTYRCKHSKCNKRCGEPCTPCREPCARNCKHSEHRCRSKCSATCTVPPCENPCEKKLRCGHHCAGFCGDPCPPLCRICDEETLTEVFFGDEDEEGARFVLLVDCGHVVESEGMKRWLDASEDAIGVKLCPKCKATIVNTYRYSDYIKRFMKNVTDVKRKFYGSEEANILNGEMAIERVDVLLATSRLCKVLPTVTTVCNELKDQLRPVKNNKRQMLSDATIQIAKAKLQVLENICAIYNQATKNLTVSTTNSENHAYLKFLVDRLSSEKHRMTEQEVEDFEVEQKRVQRMMQLYAIERRQSSVRARQGYAALKQRIYACEKYDVASDENIGRELKELAKLFGTLDVTEAELQQIVKVIGVKSGAWYKCRNGHPYAIGDCGGAMELSQCADCGAPIGGRSHALTAGNTHANFDGSRHAAWSEGNNLGNFMLD